MSEQTQHTLIDLDARIEAILFVAGGAVAISQLSEVLDCSQKEIEGGIQRLTELYNRRGLGIQRSSNRVQLTTSPYTAEVIERFLGLESSARLSRAALETLAIVAYRQPITRPGIDAIRGVSSDGVLKSLLSKGLVQEVGRAEGPGRPVLFGVTTEFLQYFGLSSLEELPPFEDESNPDDELKLLKD